VVVHNATQPLESRATPRHIISEGSSGPTYIASALQVAALELSDQHRRLRRRHSPKLNNPPLNKRRQLNTWPPREPNQRNQGSHKEPQVLPALQQPLRTEGRLPGHDFRGM